MTAHFSGLLRRRAAIPVLFCTIGLAAFTAVSRPAYAATNGAWSVFPTVAAGAPARLDFEARLTAGQAYRDSVTVSNLTDRAMTFDLYAADAFTTPEGAFSVRRTTDPKLDMGNWVHLSESHVTLQPRTDVDIPFSVDVPVSATGGDHVAGIVAQSTEIAPSQRGNVQVDELHAVGVRVYGRVVGDQRAALEITKIGLDVRRDALGELGGRVNTTVTFTVRNNGTVRLSPKAYVDVSPLVGVGRSVERDLPELLPGDELDLKTPLDGVLPIGALRAGVRVTAGSASVQRSTRALVLPWYLLALFVIGTAALTLARRRERSAKRASSA